MLWPLAPDDINRTVSLVEVQPSESIRLYVRSAARVKIPCALSETIASVITTDSMVANAGASIPAPLAIPENSTPYFETVAIFGTESVVIIACAARSRELLPISAAIRLIPSVTLSIGNNSPINPVEQTITSPEEIDKRSPTNSALTWVSIKPCGPVQAFAPPEFRTTARTRPPLATSFDHITGAATTLLVVNTATASKRGP